MMPLDPIGVALRVTLMYFYALFLVRLSGKQSIRHLTTMDFVVITIVGDLFDDVFWKEVPVLSGLAAFAAVVLVHILVSYVASRNKTVLRLVSPAPALIIQNGRLVIENLRRERLRREAVLFEMRLGKEDDLQSVREARLEPNGQCSFLNTEDSKPIQKKEMKHFQWGKPYHR
jgi:uncharacterized membrane protein YcaP (DUF421 family)